MQLEDVHRTYSRGRRPVQPQEPTDLDDPRALPGAPLDAADLTDSCSVSDTSWVTSCRPPVSQWPIRQTAGLTGFIQEGPIWQGGDSAR